MEVQTRDLHFEALCTTLNSNKLLKHLGRMDQLRVRLYGIFWMIIFQGQSTKKTMWDMCIWSNTTDSTCVKRQNDNFAWHFAFFGQVRPMICTIVCRCRGPKNLGFWKWLRFHMATIGIRFGAAQLDALFIITSLLSSLLGFLFAPEEKPMSGVC